MEESEKNNDVLYGNYEGLDHIYVVSGNYKFTNKDYEFIAEGVIRHIIGHNNGEKRRKVATYDLSKPNCIVKRIELVKLIKKYAVISSRDPNFVTDKNISMLIEKVFLLLPSTLPNVSVVD